MFFFGERLPMTKSLFVEATCHDEVVSLKFRNQCLSSDIMTAILVHSVEPTAGVVTMHHVFQRSQLHDQA